MSSRILVVDDDSLLRRSLALQLEQAGYRAFTAASAEDALALVERDPPDLILLDVSLPGMDGLEALRRLKRDGDIPVVFVTARRRDLDTILGLELGADDFITKPFNPDVLLARIRSVLRRRDSSRAIIPQREVLTVGDIVMDPTNYSVTVTGKPVELNAREFALLHVLALSAGKNLSVDDLIARVWGAEYSGEPQVVYVHIHWLREKIEEDPAHPTRIVNMRGAGYRLVPR